MLQLTGVSKLYGAERALESVSFVVNHGERVGLVGPNGSGKSTLLRIIAGLEQPDAGTVRVQTSKVVGYLPQGQGAELSGTVDSAVRSGLHRLQAARVELEHLTARLAEQPATPQRLQEYGEAQARFEAAGGYGIENRIAEVMTGLGLETVRPETPLTELSGGQRTRVGMARLLLSRPDLLLLDEPTNHLDIEALEWLEEFIRGFKGTALIVSHDRIFLDRTIFKIFELDQGTHRITVYTGGYQDYELAKQRRLDKQWAAWKDQQAETRRIESDIRRTKEQARHTERGTDNDHYRRLAKKVAHKAKAREHRLQRYLESEERVDKPAVNWRMKLEFGEMPRGGQIVLSLDRIGHRFDDRWLFRGVGQTLQHGERIALLGPNGSGKTTLLRMIAGELEPTEGQVQLGANVRPGYMPQEQETLEPDSSPLELIRSLAPLSETAARHLLHFFLFEGDEVFVRIGELSFGERARLLLARLVVGQANLLILDEPINHLDISSRERFEAALHAFPGTILISAHDRAFVDRFATAVWSLEDETLRRYPDRASMPSSLRRLMAPAR